VQLPKIKSEKPISIDQKIAQHTDETNEVSPVYPGGINAFRQETANNFYAGTIDANGKISSEIVFVIERDGTIVDVKATGSNDNFNRQAELAVYLAKYKWEAARIDGHPVRYRFHIPLNLNFD
jgi:protein TonB